MSTEKSWWCISRTRKIHWHWHVPCEWVMSPLRVCDASHELRVQGHVWMSHWHVSWCVNEWLQHTATHCNTLQHTATHCNTLQHAATHFYTRAMTQHLQHHRWGCATHFRQIYDTVIWQHTNQDMLYYASSTPQYQATYGWNRIIIIQPQISSTLQTYEPYIHWLQGGENPRARALIRGPFAENDMQGKAFYGSLAPYTGWQRYIGCLKLQVSFHKGATNYRVFLQKMTYTDKAFHSCFATCTHLCRVAKTHRMLYLRRSFPAKEPCN